LRTFSEFGRISGYLVIILIALAAVSSFFAYSTTIYRADQAIGLLSRAETAGFAEDMIAYIGQARDFIPDSGNPVWWFPTRRTDFALIQMDLESILERARLISTLPRDSEAYQQGMDDIRGKLRTVQDQIGEAAPYMLATPLSLTLSAFWLGAQAFLIGLYFRTPRAPMEKSPLSGRAGS
jgi:hypothetical protein